MRHTANWLETYLEYTSGQESPEVYHYWCGISILCATLLRNVWVDMGGYFRIYPNMYIILVGPTGVGKSTAADIAIDNIYSEAFPDREIMRGKISMTKMLYDMQDEHRKSGTSAIYIYAPEFRVFSNAQAMASSMLEDMADLYGCPRLFKYRTRNRGILQLENVCVNMLGASIPEWLCTASGESIINTGFSARVLYIGARSSERLFYKPQPPPNADELRRKLVHDLREIARLSGPFIETPEADIFHKEWYEQAKAPSVYDSVNEKLHGYIKRKDGHLLKLAMAQKAAYSDERVLTREDLEHAARTLESIEKDMELAYNAISFSSIEALMDKILTILKGAKTGHITHRELLRRVLGYKGFSGRQIEEVLESMVKAGIITIEMGLKGSRLIRFHFKEEEYMRHKKGDDYAQHRNALPDGGAVGPVQHSST